MPTADLSDATLVTTLAATDRVVSLTATGNAQQIVKTDLMTEILGDNVTEADLDKLHSITSSAAELNILDGASASLVIADLNLLAGKATSGLTGAELGYVHGATSSIQGQLDGKATLDNIKFRPYQYSLNFKMTGGTSKAISNSTIFTSFGLSAATSYIVATAFCYSLFDHATGGGGISVATTTNVTWDESLITGSTYETTSITFNNLTEDNFYSIAVTVLILPRP